MQYAVYVGELEVPGWLVLAGGTLLMFGLAFFSSDELILAARLSGSTPTPWAA